MNATEKYDPEDALDLRAAEHWERTGEVLSEVFDLPIDKLEEFIDAAPARLPEYEARLKKILLAAS